MPFRLAAIGFDAENPRHIQSVAERLAVQQDPIPVPGGLYLGCKDDQGAELWLHFDSDQKCHTVKPHFAGQGRMRILATEPVERTDSLLEGALFGWAVPERVSLSYVMNSRNSSASSLPAPSPPGAFPLVFDVPGWLALPPLAYPAHFDVQLAGFAQDIVYFRSETEMRSVLGPHTETKPRFVPVGLMRPIRTTNGFLPPASVAAITGVVVESRKCVNPHTYLPYIWTLVQTEGGTVDLLCATEALETVPKPGGWICGTFWLSGQLLLSDPNELPSHISLN
jgi:hypothetical protein